MLLGNIVRPCDQLQRAKYTDSQLLYRHTHAYGVLDVLENMPRELNGAWNYDDVDKMWPVIFTLAHWLNTGSGEMWQNIDRQNIDKEPQEQHMPASEAMYHYACINIATFV
ncbi:hypothetical protein AC578_2706 [Pseudocercospora eumusae]|uniref:Uncharacterized protein n=1 Tax=Pseudocercospora eumusae TaxID=321146 RepID=A0A139HFR8_9PEZI|nr:hypothetical protein AC578_2706 [Pseudocercospora eumusae]